MIELDGPLIIGDRHMASYCGTEHQIVSVAVFSSGIYFEDVSEKVLLLHDISCGSLPFGLGGAGISQRGKMLQIVPGMLLRLGEGALRDRHGHVIAKLICAAPFEFRPFLSVDEGIDHLCTKGLEQLEQEGRSKLVHFCRGQREEIAPDPGDPFLLIGAAGIRCLRLGLLTADAGLISAGLDRILGLGPGLTPSFDDLLTGLSGALNFFAREWETDHPSRELLNSMLRERAKKRTNRFSAAYLLAAAEGRSISAIDMAIASAGGERWGEALSALTGIGSSSGADMMCGVVFAAGVMKDSSLIRAKKVGT